MNRNENQHSDEPDCMCAECEYKYAVAHVATAKRVAAELKREVICIRLEAEVLRLATLICNCSSAMCLSAETLEIQQAYATLDTLQRIVNGPEEEIAF